MGKQIYLIRQTSDGSESYSSNEGYSAFSERIKSLVDQLKSRGEVQRLSYTITEEKPPAVSTIPFGKNKISSISVHKEEGGFIEEAIEQGGCIGAYQVEEALPVSYERSWSGEKTPGVCLLTLFRKKKSIDYSTFIDRWHNGHTPLSLKLHPLWHYSRNVVQNKDNQKEHYDGIVEEHTRTRRELLNPIKFFGGPLTMIPNMIKVYFDVKGFLDYSSIDPYLTREYIIK